MMTFGIIFSFSVQAFLFIPLLPDMTDYALSKYHKSTHERVNNMVSAMFNASVNVGNALGAIMGALLNDRIGFRLTADVIGISVFIVGIIYFFTTNSIEAFRQTRLNY